MDQTEELFVSNKVSWDKCTDCEYVSANGDFTINRLLQTRIIDIYDVVQFYPWFSFYFPLFYACYRTLPWTKTKENKNWTKDKIEPQHNMIDKQKFANVKNVFVAQFYTPASLNLPTLILN